MKNFILRRLLQTLPMLLLASFIIFMLFAKTPGDFIDGNVTLTAARAAELKAIYGLDQPLFTRYLHWLGQLLRGDLGFSLQYQIPVSQLLNQYIWNSFLLASVALVFYWGIGLAVGVVSALRPGSWFDHLVSVAVFAAMSFPTFFLCLLLIKWFAVDLHWLPVGGMTNTGSDESGWQYVLQVAAHLALLEAVYNYMLEDLNYAIGKLPRMRPNQMEHKGAVTAFTAQALAARIYLLKGDYAQVETLTDDIIKNGGFRLYDDFYQLFKIPGKLCDESLFECQVTDYGNGSGDYLGVDQWFNFQGPNMAEKYVEVVNADGTISYKQAEGAKSIGGWNFIGYEPEFVAWAEARGEGVRAETSFLKALSKTREGWQVGPTSATKTDCWNGKGYLPYNQMTLPRTTYGANNNVRIIRYAEVLLMNSEAKVRLGKDGDAGYNEVRRRAGMSTKTGVTLKDVMDERRMELCGEWCARYVDLVRTGDAATVLGPKGWTAEKTYWPIPANQLDDLPDLKLEPIDGIAE